MKKQYKKPEINEVEITNYPMLSTSFDIDSSTQGDEKEDFARGHRGTWGDLWIDNN